MTENNETPQNPENAGAEQAQQPVIEAQPVNTETAEISKDAMNMAMLGHLLAIFTGFLGPLIIWLIKKDDAPFVERHGREALNFQLTILIAMFVSGLLAVFCIGFIFMMVIWIVDIIFCIIAAVKASKGEEYSYPMTIRFVK